MKISILYRTADYRGDHAADSTIAYAHIEGERIENLVARIIPQDRTVDWIEIRRIVGD